MQICDLEELLISKSTVDGMQRAYLDYLTYILADSDLTLFSDFTLFTLTHADIEVRVIGVTDLPTFLNLDFLSLSQTMSRKTRVNLLRSIIAKFILKVSDMHTSALYLLDTNVFFLDDELGLFDLNRDAFAESIQQYSTLEIRSSYSVHVIPTDKLYAVPYGKAAYGIDETDVNFYLADLHPSCAQLNITDSLESVPVVKCNIFANSVLTFTLSGRRDNCNSPNAK